MEPRWFGSCLDSFMFSCNYSLVLLWEFLDLVTLDHVLAFANYC